MKTKDVTKVVLDGEETTVKSAPETENQPVETPKKKKIAPWKGVLVGGVPGIIFGVAGTLATEEVASAAESEIVDDTFSEGSAPVHDVAPVATEVNDDMSFSDAFAAARAEVGPGGVFSWHGQVYGTYNKPEWDSLSDEQRQEYSQSVAQAQVHPEPYTPQPSDPEIVEVDQPTVEDSVQNIEQDTQEEMQSEEVALEPEADAEELEVEIIGVTQMEDESGEVYDVGVGSVGGHDAAFLDLEGDGEVDTVIIDENDNGEVDEGEVYDASGSGISVSDMIAMADDGGVPEDDGLYDGMPDYTNDADTSSLA